VSRIHEIWWRELDLDADFEENFSFAKEGTPSEENRPLIPDGISQIRSAKGKLPQRRVQ